MSYHAIAESWESGSEVWLVELTLLESGRKLRATNQSENVTLNGEVFKATPISIDYMSSHDNGNDSSIEVLVPSDGNEIAALFYPNLATDIVEVRIMHGSFETPESNEIAGTILAFVGRATSATKKGNEVKIECLPRSAEADKYALNLKYSRECGLQLFGRRCAASRSFATAPATIEKHGGAFRVVIQKVSGTLYSAEPDRSIRPLGVSDLFSAELTFMSQFTEKKWRISPEAMSQNGTHITLTGVIPQFDEAELAALIDTYKSGIGTMLCYVTLSCGRTLDFCHLVHRNASNFWGFPTVPHENVSGSSLENYKG